MQRLVVVVAFLFLLTSCAQSDVSVTGQEDAPASVPTTTATPATTDAGIGLPEPPSLFVCPDGSSFELAVHEYDLGDAPDNELTLSDGRIIWADQGWTELEGRFVDRSPLEFTGILAMRVVDQASGLEQACPQDRADRALSGSSPAAIESCAVSDRGA